MQKLVKTKVGVNDNISNPNKYIQVNDNGTKTSVITENEWVKMYQEYIAEKNDG